VNPIYFRDMQSKSLRLEISQVEASIAARVHPLSRDFVVESTGNDLRHVKVVFHDRFV
jgi:hypothetical protein